MPAKLTLSRNEEPEWLESSLGSINNPVTVTIHGLSGPGVKVDLSRFAADSALGRSAVAECVGDVHISLAEVDRDIIIFYVELLSTGKLGLDRFAIESSPIRARSSK